jgi:hypothetical protein
MTMATRKNVLQSFGNLIGNNLAIANRSLPIIKHALVPQVCQPQMTICYTQYSYINKVYVIKMLFIPTMQRNEEKERKKYNIFSF